jgi:hypothetical protein
MKRLRTQIILLTGWLVIFYSIDRLIEPVRVDSITNVLILAMVAIPLFVYRFINVPLWLLTMAPVTFLLGFKVWTGELAVRALIPLTMFEIGAVIETTILAYWVSESISEFENVVTRITIGQSARIPESLSQGSGSLYREVRRARNHQRPLALLAIGVEENSLTDCLDRLVKDAQMAMMRQYALSRISRSICEGLEDCDVVVQDNNHFMVMLPETKPEDLPSLMERLRLGVSQEIGVELVFGSAVFPEDSFTLEGLIEKATRDMQKGCGSDLLIDLAKLHVKQPGSELHPQV